MPGFAENFIDALTRGQQFLRTKRQQQWEEEDRGIQKDLLQHRLRDLKIQDRIRARSAAIENLNALEGQPENTFPIQATDADLVKQTIGSIPGVVPKEGMATRQVPVIDVPGIEELGVPGFQRKPRTMEEVLQQQIADLRAKAMWTPHTVARGGVEVIPGMATPDNPKGIVAQGDPYPERTHTFVTRDAAGNERTELLTDDEFRKRGAAIRAPLPRRGGGNGITRATDEDIEASVARVANGLDPASKAPSNSSDLGIRWNSRMNKLFPNFSVTRAAADEKAFSSYLNSINSGQQATILQASEAAKQALDALEEQLTKGASGLDLEDTKKAVRMNLAILKSGGSSPTNKALSDAENELASGLWDKLSGDTLKAKIGRLRTNLAYRTGAIKGAFMSSEDVTRKPTAGGSAAGKPDPLGIRQ